MFEKVQDPPTNLAILALHPKNIGIDGQTYTPLQFQYRPQANGIPSESTGTRKGPCSVCPTAYVDQTEELKISVRRQDKNLLLALHSLITGHAFFLDQDLSCLGYGSFKGAREFSETRNTTPMPVHGHISMLQNFARVFEE